MTSLTMASPAAASATSARMVTAWTPSSRQAAAIFFGGLGVAGVVHRHIGALAGQLQADGPADPRLPPVTSTFLPCRLMESRSFQGRRWRPPAPPPSPPDSI